MMQQFMRNNMMRQRMIYSLIRNFSNENGPQLTTENAQKLIEKWVKNNKICLFMKGTPDSPKCGYSNFVVEILKKYGITEYKAIDIL